MKLILRITMALLAFSVLFTACKKEKKTNPNTLPSIINTIVSQAQIDSLKKHGTIINEGTTPPTVSGAFLLSPDICSFDNSGDNYSGQTFDDYAYKFSKQNTSKYTIRLDYTNVANDGDDSGSDSTATYISGSGKLFTVFAQSSGLETGVNYTNIQILSGEVTTGGIANFQVTDYLESKGADPNNMLEPVGTTRIFYDSDKLSTPYTETIVLNSLKAKVLDAIKSNAKSMHHSK
jgi:hypothetical protein